MEKKFIFLQGLPGIGKSTWVKKNNLENYVVCPDSIRIELSIWNGIDPYPEYKEFNGKKFKFIPTETEEGLLLLTQDEKGNIGIDQTKSGFIFNVEVPTRIKRMVDSNSPYIVFDATNTKEDRFEVCKYAREKGYTIICVHFPEDINLAKERNLLRPKYKYVPEFVIDNMYKSLQNFDRNKLPYVKFIESDEVIMIYDEMCLKFNCEHYIEWQTESDEYYGHPYICVSCKLVGQSYHIEEIPKECEYFKKLFLEQFLNNN